jgi:hypothetical protein
MPLIKSPGEAHCPVNAGIGLDTQRHHCQHPDCTHCLVNGYSARGFRLSGALGGGRGRCNPAKGQGTGLRPDWRGGPATASNGRRVGTRSPLQCNTSSLRPKESRCSDELGRCRDGPHDGASEVTRSALAVLCCTSPPPRPPRCGRFGVATAWCGRKPTPNRCPGMAGAPLNWETR